MTATHCKCGAELPPTPRRSGTRCLPCFRKHHRKYNKGWYSRARKNSRVWIEENKSRAKLWRENNAEHVHAYDVARGKRRKPLLAA